MKGLKISLGLGQRCSPLSVAFSQTLSAVLDLMANTAKTRNLWLSKPVQVGKGPRVVLAAGIEHFSDFRKINEWRRVLGTTTVSQGKCLGFYEK